MKVLFLDVDGVLNNFHTKEKCLGFTGVDKSLARRFTKWMDYNRDVKIVLSSTWRTDERMWYALHNEGIAWVDKTDELDGRPEQIDRWLKANKHEKFIILDDQDYGWMPYQIPRFVQTNDYFGVTDDDLKKVAALLA